MPGEMQDGPDQIDRKAGPSGNLWRRYIAGPGAQSAARNIVAGVVVALLAVLGFGWVAHRSTTELQSNSRDAMRTQNALRQMSDLITALRQAESSQRGFLLTGDRDLLRTYYAGVHRLDASLAAITDFASGDDRGSQRFAELGDNVRRRISLMDSVVNVYNASGFAAAQQVLGTGVGPLLTERIVDQVTAEERAEYGRLMDQVQAAQAGARFSARGIIVSTLLATFVVLVAGLLLLRDARRQQRTEEELRRALEAAAEASESKTRFLATVSHEIRTPLNAILGMTELLLDGRMGPEQREQVRIVNTNSESLAALISDLLDSSKIEAGQVDLDATVFDPIEAVENVAEILQVRAEAKGLELVVDADPAMPLQVRADAARLRQVLMNVVGNAVKFTSHGGVSISAELIDAGPGQHRLRIDVSDSGIGIAPENRDRIFERFSQAERSTSRRFGGTGLGLNISRSLTELMGGSLTFTSEYGRGSTFTISLPVEVVTPRPRAAEGRSLSGKRVLVITGSPSRQTAISRVLEAEGAAVVRAGTGSEGIAMTAAEVLSLAVIDEKLLDFPALEFLRLLRMRERTASLPVVMLCEIGSGLPSAAAPATNTASVYKPVRQERLLAAVARVLGGDEATVVVADDQQAASTAGNVRPRILVAEDQPDNRNLVMRILQGAGYEVDFAENGGIAVQKLARLRYDLVLMDLAMPVVDGLEATRRIRAAESAASEPRVPIVALTAHALEMTREQAIESGMDDYLTKPIKKQHLLDSCAKWIDRRPLVLIADDSRQTHVLFTSYLKGVDVRTLSVYDGTEAVAQFERRGVALVLMDVDMPVMGGLEAAGAIRRLDNGGSVPIIAISGYDSAEDKRQAAEAGCTFHLAKPVRRAEFIAAVESAIGQGAGVPPAADSTAAGSDSLAGVLERLRKDVAAVGRLLEQRDFSALEDVARGLHDVAVTANLRNLTSVLDQLLAAVRRADVDSSSLWARHLKGSVEKSERLLALRRSGLLDSPPEEVFDRLTRMASELMHVPTVVVSLVDEDRQFFKSGVGIAAPFDEMRGTPMSHSICQYVVERKQRLVQEDVRLDAELQDNLSIRDLGLVAYAGIPLITSDGYALGTMCAMDTQPRKWSSEEISILENFAGFVMEEIERRLSGRPRPATSVLSAQAPDRSA